MEQIIGDIDEILRSAIESAQITAPVAASRLHALAESLTPEQNRCEPKDGQWWIYNQLLRSVTRYTWDDARQNRSVQVVRALKNLPSSDLDWPRLPGMGMAVREEWNRAPAEAGSEPSGDAYNEAEWTALNAFAARLTKLGTLDFKLFAIWQMRSALEFDNDAAILNNHIPAAAMWILLCGPEIARMNDIWRPSPSTGDPARGGPLWQGVHGFGNERWQFWKERFGDVMLREELTEETRAMARQAFASMS